MRFFVILLIFTLLSACKDTSSPGDTPAFDRKKAKESLEKANRVLVHAEEENINDFVKRYGWDVEKTGSGLRYMIYKAGDGPKVEKGINVSLAYDLRFLTGDIVYSSTEDGLLTFQAGRGGVPSGLEEGILLLHKGDRAKFILPSHLAFGLLGDNKRIPPRAVLVYDVEVLNLK
jgi:FKBP-type peptidyl-prolyl cis-trans isomerase FkpA